ncbi:hypothetical protein [Streptomyces sp. MBT27]|uniref:hypothetical protein n=1 Tax=Streptomyces sp. MBT27 TaxID=1488356 RepID=UPI001423136E|nr:hypothetical protein [Streptomyces sp. MBT27]
MNVSAGKDIGVFSEDDAEADQAAMLAEEIAAFERRTPPFDELDPGIEDVVRAFADLPGITTVSSCQGHPDRDGPAAEWHIAWVLRSADPALSISDAGPHPEGWLTTEFLIWHARDLARAGDAITYDVTAPFPLMNYPGRAMTFFLRGRLAGRGALTPAAYLEQLRHAWVDTGYADWLVPAADGRESAT